MALLSIPVLSMATAACGGTPNASTSQDSVDIQVSVSQTHKVYLDPMIAEFEKANPTINVNPIYAPTTTRTKLLASQLQAGNAPDIFAVSPGWGGTSSALKLAQAGELADLTDTPWAKLYSDEMKSTIGLDGKVQAWVPPLGFNYLMYNADTMASLGVNPPKTFDELLSSCRTISAKGKIPISIAAGSTTMTNSILTVLSANNVYGPSPDWNQERLKGGTTFASSPEWRAVFDDYQALIDASCFDKLSTGMTEVSQATADLANGKAAMQVGANSSFSNLPALNPSSRFGAVAFPGRKEDQTFLNVDYAPVLVAYKKSKHPDAAMKFLEFLEQNSGEVGSRMNSLPVADAVAGTTTKDLDYLEPWLKTERTRTSFLITMPKQGMDVFETVGKSVQGLFTGEANTDSLLKVMDDSWK